MRSTGRFQAAGVLVCGLLIASGCSSSPTAPSQSPAAASSIGSNAESQVIAQQASLSSEDLAARGWDCRQSPFNPSVVTCSPPNQVHPMLLTGPPPPTDRPASITLLVFVDGAYAGTNLLIRSDLYQGQECRSTSAPYRFIARIGYYECLHQSQAS